jgi:phosphoribosylanthranilate isomerase
MVKVKICGITSWADARKSIEEGADLLGFNFYRESPRYIAPAAAARIIKRLPKGIKAVGVFVNESEENILAIVHAAGIQQIQMHGDESPETVTRLGRKLPVIKAIRLSGQFQASCLSDFVKADALLLDTFNGDQFGGTGKTFDWRVIRSASEKKKLFLAGGLTPENVEEAIRIGHPYAVDVCSGVEARPGKKDPRRIEAFMRAVRSANHAGKLVAKRKTKSKMRKKR